MVSVDLPIEIIGAIALFFFASLMGNAFLGTYYLDMKSKNPELDVFLKARKKPFPDIVALIDLSGRFLLFNGTKKKPYDVRLEKDEYGLLLDSRLAAKRPRSRLEDGTSLMMYGTNFHFPFDPSGARGLIQLIHKIRNTYKELNFIKDDVVLIELLTKSGDDIEHDLGIVLNMFPQEEGREVTTERLIEIFEEIKSNLKLWRVEPEFFSMKDALDLLPIGTTSTDMKRVETITKINTQNEMQSKEPGWMQFGYFIAAIIGVMVVAYMLITAMKPAGP